MTTVQEQQRDAIVNLNASVTMTVSAIRIAVFGIITIAISSMPVWAAENLSCGTSQQEMNACAAEEYKKADAELNLVYRKLLEMDDADGQAKLKSAELAWMKFRDSQCDYLNFRAEGGSAYNQWQFQCITVETNKRIVDLKKFLNCTVSPIFCELGSNN